MDRLIEETVVREDPAAAKAVRESDAAGLPEIQVSAAQGKFLHLTTLVRGAKRALEIGTLGGYSAIWVARALPADGQLITLELEPDHAEVARRNIQAAGLSERVEVRVGAAQDLLPVLAEEMAEPFDLVFIDADKAGLPTYFSWALRLSRRGTVIICDNVVRAGAVLDADSADPDVLGVRELLEQLRGEGRVSATVVQTVGVKGYDGFLFAVVN